MSKTIKSRPLLRTVLSGLAVASIGALALSLSPIGQTSHAEAEVTPATTTLTINFPGFKGNKGNMMVAVYDQSSWLRKPVANAKVAAKPNMTAVIADLPPGTYGVAVYHDKDSDGKMKTGIFGIPAEAYGFSNDAEGHMGPAAFADASFTLAPTGTTISIKVR